MDFVLETLRWSDLIAVRQDEIIVRESQEVTVTCDILLILRNVAWLARINSKHTLLIQKSCIQALFSGAATNNSGFAKSD
jgi:hypothetical protein